jgi:hypothetical protein
VADEYIEPSNEQLARFLVVYAKRIPEMAILQLDETSLKFLLDRNPLYRKGALRHHRRYQEELNKMATDMREGKLQCAHTLLSGKQCPNRNEPGTMYCGLQQQEDE